VQIKEGGATWDYADYQPHLTLTWQAAEDMNLADVEPYRGPIELGPEIFEEIRDGWSGTFEEDANPNHEPAGSDRGGEFASASGGGGGPSARLWHMTEQQHVDPEFGAPGSRAAWNVRIVFGSITLA
jgi:hypothetical protein